MWNVKIFFVRKKCSIKFMKNYIIYLSKEINFIFLKNILIYIAKQLNSCCIYLYK